MADRDNARQPRRARRGRGRIAAAALGAALVAGCGSTVQGAPSLRGGGGPGGLSAPSGAATGGSASSYTGGGVPGDSTGSVANGAGAGGGSLGGGPSGTVRGAAATGAGGTVAAGNGPGVTATTINIAAEYDPNAAAEDSALGIASANPGDVQAETDALLRYINSHGGVAHRKLVPVWYRINSQDDATTTGQKSCAYWTQDHKVFLLGGGSQQMDECTAHAHAIAIDANSIVEQTGAVNRQFPEDVNLDTFTIDRAMGATISGLARQGYFSQGAKVGIATWDDTYYRYGITTAVTPALSRLGLSNVPVSYIAVPQSYGDISSTSAAVGNAILKFRSAGIDHVILFDGPAGVNASGLLVIEWENAAGSQQYYPKYGLNSTSGFNAANGAVPEKEQENSVGIDWFPALSATADEYSKIPLPANGQLCRKIMKDAGQEQSSPNAEVTQFAMCDTLFFLKQALDPVAGPINQQTALAAINAMGTRYASSVTWAINISPSQHDGALLVRNMAFDTGCTCYRYTNAAYKP